MGNSESTAHKKQRVLAVGVFDLFHIGHLRYLQYARAQAEYLMVAVTTDAISYQSKQKYPVIDQQQRMEIIEGLGWVDEARLQPCTLSQAKAAGQWMAEWQIDHLVLGGDWLHSARHHQLAPELAVHGISLDFALRTEQVSSTDIIRRVVAQAVD